MSKPTYSFSIEPEKLSAYDEALSVFAENPRAMLMLPCPSLLCQKEMFAYDAEQVERMRNGECFCPLCEEHGESAILRKFHAVEPRIFREGATATDVARFRQEEFEAFRSFFSRALTPEAGAKTSLYVFGDTGAQKSRMLFRAMNPTFLRKNKTFRVLRGGDLRKEFALALQGDRFGGDRIESVKTELMDVSLLVFDDFGQDKLTENMLADLWQVLDYRFGEGKPNVFLSNVPPADIAERYKNLFSLDSLTRRILEFSEILAVVKK